MLSSAMTERFFHLGLDHFLIITTYENDAFLRPCTGSCKQNLPLALSNRYPAVMQPKNRGWMVLALFFCSGFCNHALVYEVVWSKFLSQMFGSTVYAQTVVLAVFMGGLALGNRLFGKWADGLQQPVRAYGFLEIAIGVYALLFPTLDRVMDHIFVAVGTPLASKSGLLLALKGVLAAALLLGPTILMGGTLPLLAAWLQKFSTDAGQRSARFYSVNSLGAVTRFRLRRIFPGAKFRDDSGRLQISRTGRMPRSAFWQFFSVQLSGWKINARGYRKRIFRRCPHARPPADTALGRFDCRHDRWSVDGTRSVGIPFTGAHFWFVIAILRHRADGVYSWHRLRQRLDCLTQSRAERNG